MSVQLKPKLDQFHAMLNQWLTDIVICTESWLTPEIFNAEIIPDSLGYTMFRQDRGSRGGGVFILVRDLYIANRVQEWETNCEILWIKLQLAGSVPLHIAAYYKPNEFDPQSFAEFKKSVEKVSTVKDTHGYLGILTTPNCPGQIIYPPLPLTVSTHTSMRSSLTF